MSQFSYQPSSAPQPTGSSALAIAALVCGCIGIFIPGVGIVAVILAIIALTRATMPPGAKGLAIAGLCVGAVSIITSLMCIGILLPALGKARQSARQLKSSTHVRQIGIALQSYAMVNKDWMPESADGLDRLVASGILAPEMLITPHAPDSSTTSYIYIPPSKPISNYPSPERFVIAYENPLLVRGSVNILFLDGHVEPVSASQLNQMLAKQGSTPVPGSTDGSPGGR